MPSPSFSKETLRQIGEKGVLNRLKKFMDEGQIDDDTALIRSSSKDLLINTDIFVEDIHFSESTTSAINVGWKAVVANLSDLASSGVDDVIAITVGLVAPPSTEWKWVDDAYQGIKNALEEFGGKLIGGDCSSGKQKIISITAIGQKGPLHLHRSNAQPGDLLVTSGPHGLSRLGLGLLQSDKLTNTVEIPESLKNKAIKAHQKPYPPIDSLKKLVHCKPPHLPWRAAGTDSSDGLINAVENLCTSSQCKAILEPNNLPKFENWPLGKEWDEWCLYGGEDFELVLSLPSEWAKEWLQEIPLSKCIGTIEKGLPEIIWGNGTAINRKSNIEFHHF
ncbi:thiamine-phosphate kinase [Prochlorococcus marinus]|uniref:thiamine-phosphate kinase n=1 Tax=Prochlorococcus marinus TaxID=1219 RepID=UPI0022B5CCB8|nr:thiamine-phosphate kinase [Prochlorococcus marinus]